MYVVDRAVKTNLARFWSLPDRVFFACGACQVLGYAAFERHGALGFRPKWLRPAAGFRGNHIILTDGERAFDYHGWTRLERLLAHAQRKAERWWPGWRYDFLDFSPEALICETASKAAGLHLRQPDQFLHDALPRARGFVDRYPLP